MKTLIKFVTAACAAVLAISCTKDIDFIEPQPQTVPLTVNVGTVITRAKVNGTEDMTLKNVQVIVFNDKGKLEKSSNLVGIFSSFPSMSHRVTSTAMPLACME